MIETMANGYSSDSTQQELSTEHQYDRVKMIFIQILLFGALDESNLSIRGVNNTIMQWRTQNKTPFTTTRLC